MISNIIITISFVVAVGFTYTEGMHKFSVGLGICLGLWLGMCL